MNFHFSFRDIKLKVKRMKKMSIIKLTISFSTIKNPKNRGQNTFNWIKNSFLRVYNFVVKNFSIKDCM